MAVVFLLELFHFALAVIGIALIAGSAHGDEGEEHMSEDILHTNECSLAADEHETCKEGHQNSCNEEGVPQDLEVDSRTVCEEALRPDHKKGDQQLDANAYTVIP